MKTSIKALGAALALTVAASAPAFANGSAISEAGLPQVLQNDASYSNVQVSGFTGVNGATFTAAMDDPSDAGRPLNLQEGNETTVFGFRGIQQAPSYVIEHSPFTR